ncbi:NAD-dependent epimerase/dehydratase family protein [Hyphococcus lacteus]|uniref:NAD-dependent epimerase/dehydratase family protein n=1 Tax=Hyphococcus lacteus TaxID=3143536 RepID=A0ABV3Z535_9PROT
MSSYTVVPGGAGFVGKVLVATLRERGERVRSFDLAPASHPDDVQGSILNSDDLRRAFEGAQSIFHLAGNAQLWARDNTVFERINHLGTKNVLEAALSANVGRVVHCSSLTTLVGRKTSIEHSTANEDLRLEPASMLGAYPRSKLWAERAVESAVSNGLDAVIAVPTEPIGPGDVGLTPPTQMILDFANGKTPAYIDCILNFVPLDSLAQGLIAVRDKGRRGQRYILGGANTPMRDLLVMIESATGRKMPKTKLPYFVALLAGAIDTGLVSTLTQKPPKAPLTGVRLAGRQVSFSSEKAAKELGWRASELAPALHQTLKWLEEQGLLKSV